MPNLDTSLVDARYGKEIPLPETVLELGNSTIESLLRHRSVRSYNTRPLDPGVLELIVAAAQSASTSSNLQSYTIIAVESKERKLALAQLAGRQQHIVDAPVYLLFCADLARLHSIATAHGSKAEALDYAEMFIMSVIDATLAAQNLVVAAEALGLGTCYIGGARNHPEKLASLVNLPDKVFAVFGLTVGYPLTNDEKVKPRLPQTGAILQREQYNDNFNPAIAEYEDVMKEFNNDHSGRVGRGWAEVCTRRVATPESLGAERPTIKQYLSKIGLNIK